jgi:dienelactone hydrolase
MAGCLGFAAAASARSEPAAPPLDAYGQLPTMEMATLSPSGDRIALIVRDGKRTAIYARQIDGPVLMAAPVNDGFVDDVRWAGEGVVLVQLSNIVKHDGFSSEAADVFVLNLSTKKETQLFSNGEEMAPEIYGSYGVRGLPAGWFGYYAAAACPSDTPCRRSLFKVDLQRGNPVEMDHVDLLPPWVEQALPAPQWLIGASGDAATRLIYDSRNSHWTLQAMTGGKTLSEGVAGFDGVSLLGPGRGQTAAFVTRADDGFDTLFEAPLSGAAAATAVSGGQEVQGAWADPVDGHLVGYRWADDTWHDAMFDADIQARMDSVRAAFPKKLVQVMSASHDFSRVVAFTQGDDDTGSYWLIDLRSGRATQLGSAYPQVPDAAIGAVSVFSYRAADGLPLEGVLTLPPGRQAKGLPLVVLAHGGPAERVRPGFDWLAQALASRGYAVLAPNFRGSSGFGKAFRDAGFDQLGRKMQTDLSDGVDALAATGMVDPKRVCIMGGDYGGTAAVAGVTLQHGRYRCAVSFWGLFDLGDMFARHTGPQNRVEMDYWASLIGIGKPDANLSALSPLKQAAAADAPVLLVSTRPDWTMLIDQAPAMEQALRQAGKTVVLTRIDSDDVKLRGAETRTALLKAAVPFIEQYNPPDDH